MQSDRRPLMALAHFSPPHIVAGKDYVASFSFSNLGKTVAQGATANFVLAVADAKRPPPDLVQQFKDLCDNCPPDNYPPNTPIFRSTAVDGRRITQDMVQELTVENGQLAFWFIGRIDYFDSSGLAYKTGVCYVIRLNPSCFVTCPKWDNLNYTN